MPKGDRMPTLQIRLPQTMLDSISELAVENRSSRSVFVRDLLLAALADRRARPLHGTRRQRSNVEETP